MASTCAGVNLTAFCLMASAGYGPMFGGLYVETCRDSCAGCGTSTWSRRRFLEGLAGSTAGSGAAGYFTTYGGPKAPCASSAGSIVFPGKDSTRCCQSRKVSLKSIDCKRLGRRVYVADEGSPYPRKTSCNQEGAGISDKVRRLMDSRMGRKLFSLPFLRAIML